MTLHDYFRFDEGSPIKHKYAAGEVYVVSSVKAWHSRLTGATSSAYSRPPATAM